MEKRNKHSLIQSHSPWFPKGQVDMMSSCKSAFQLLKMFVMLIGSSGKADVLMLALGKLQSYANLRYMTVLPNKKENPRLLLSNVSKLVGQYQILPFSNTELFLCVIYKDGERKLPAERNPFAASEKHVREWCVCFYDVGESNCHSVPVQPHSGHLALQSCHSGKEVSNQKVLHPEVLRKGLKKHLTSKTWLHMPWNLIYVLMLSVFYYMYAKLLATTYWVSIQHPAREIHCHWGRLTALEIPVDYIEDITLTCNHSPRESSCKNRSHKISSLEFLSIREMSSQSL